MLPEIVMIWLYRYKIPQEYIILLPTEKHKTETYNFSISLRKRGGGNRKREREGDRNKKWIFRQIGSAIQKFGKFEHV